MRARFFTPVLALLGCLLAFASVGHAQGFDFSQMQQLMQNPQVQQMVQQRLGATGATTAVAPALSTQQNSTLAAQAQTIAQQLFTPAEQTKLQQFQATPEGASIVAKLPQLMQQLAPVMLQMYAAQNVGAAGAVAPAAGATNPITWTK